MCGHASMPTSAEVRVARVCTSADADADADAAVATAMLLLL